MKMKILLFCMGLGLFYKVDAQIELVTSNTDTIQWLHINIEQEIDSFRNKPAYKIFDRLFGYDMIIREFMTNMPILATTVPGPYDTLYINKVLLFFDNHYSKFALLTLEPNSNKSLPCSPVLEIEFTHSIPYVYKWRSTDPDGLGVLGDWNVSWHNYLEFFSVKSVKVYRQ